MTLTSLYHSNNNKGPESSSLDDNITSLANLKGMSVPVVKDKDLMIDEKQVEDKVFMMREKKEEVIEVFVSKDCLADLKKDEHEMIGAMGSPCSLERKSYLEIRTVDVSEIEPVNEKVEDELVLEEAEIVEEEKSTDYEEVEIVEEEKATDYEIIQEMDEKEILKVVSEAEPVNEKLEEPIEETIINEAIVSMTEIIEVEVSVNETELVDDKLKVLFIPKPMMDGEPILTEKKEDSVSDNLMTEESRFKIDPIPKTMMDGEPILTEEKEDSVSDDLMTEESRFKIDPIGKLSKKIRKLSAGPGSKDIAVKRKNDEIANDETADGGEADGKVTDEEAKDDGVTDEKAADDDETADDGEADDRIADGKAEEPLRVLLHTIRVVWRIAL